MQKQTTLSRKGSLSQRLPLAKRSDLTLSPEGLGLSPSIPLGQVSDVVTVGLGKPGCGLWRL